MPNLVAYDVASGFTINHQNIKGFQKVTVN